MGSGAKPIAVSLVALLFSTRLHALCQGRISLYQPALAAVGPCAQDNVGDGAAPQASDNTPSAYDWEPIAALPIPAAGVSAASPAVSDGAASIAADVTAAPLLGALLPPLVQEPSVEPDISALNVSLVVQTETGLTAYEKQHLVQTAVALSAVLENTFTGIQRVAMLMDIAQLADFAALFAPSIGMLGMALAAILIFVAASDETLNFLAAQFSGVHAQLSAIEAEVGRVSEPIEADKALQTYIQEYAKVRQVGSALEEYLANIQDPSMLPTFADQCEIYPPDGFLHYVLSQLTPDGSCNSAQECILDPRAGINSEIEWSIPGYLNYTKAFVADFAHAAQLTSACAAALGVSNDTIEQLGHKLQADLSELVRNLDMYHDEVLAQGFWAEQFAVDVSTGLNSADKNQDIAANTQVLLASKYTVLQWSVGVWDAALGSDWQAVYSRLCNVLPPPPSCTATGGAYHRLRFPRMGGDEKSFAVFWSPRSEGRSVLRTQPPLETVVGGCASTAGGGWPDMVTYVDCIRDAVPNVRAVLCVKFGLGLRVRMRNLFFANRGTEFTHDTHPRPYRAAGPTVSFVILPE